ncbi:MAG: thioredoxin-like domain-containing protein [Bacteroidota bacterium]|nr:thioredoxin-like domain-containing protein [Bacteroidota bacterium]
MIKKYLLFLVVVFLLNNAFSQKVYTIKGTIKEMPSKKVILTDLYGHRQNVIDSTFIDENGKFSFTIKKKITVGFIRLMIGKDAKSQYYGGPDSYIDLIFNDENIEFYTDFKKPVDSMNIISSKENRIYYDFLKHDDKVNFQLDVLSQLPAVFPKGDDLYPEFEKKYSRLQRKNHEYIDKLIKDYPDYYAIHVIKSKRYPFLDYSLSSEGKSIFIKAHYFDNVDFLDTLLLRSEIFASKIIGYIQLFRNQMLNKEEQEIEFTNAVDTILYKASGNQKVLKYVCDYMSMGFDKLNNENIIKHIAEYYVKESTCDKNESSLDNMYKKRLEGYKKLAIGNQTPDIEDKDIYGKQISLSKVINPKVLVIFWASWCPHCMETIPELKKFYDEENKLNPGNFEVIAISLDTNKVEFSQVITKNQLNWMNICNLKGWNDKHAEDYYVYATPTMILLDKNKKILAKTTNIEELKQYFK